MIKANKSSPFKKRGRLSVLWDFVLTRRHVRAYFSHVFTVIFSGYQKTYEKTKLLTALQNAGQLPIRGWDVEAINTIFCETSDERLLHPFLIPAGGNVDYLLNILLAIHSCCMCSITLQIAPALLRSSFMAPGSQLGNELPLISVQLTCSIRPWCLQVFTLPIQSRGRRLENNFQTRHSCVNSFVLFMEKRKVLFIRYNRPLEQETRNLELVKQTSNQQVYKFVRNRNAMSSVHPMRMLFIFPKAKFNGEKQRNNWPPGNAQWFCRCGSSHE